MRSCEILKLSLLASGAVLWSFHAKAQSHPTGGVFEPPSPPVTNPFIEELRRMPIKTALPGGVSDLSLPENGGFAPNGTVYPQVTGKDVLTTYMNSLERIVALQQRNSGNNVQFPPKRFYVLRARQATHVFHPDPPYDRGSIIWGYDGMFPGPTFISRYGEPILVRIVNGLYFDENANPTTPVQQIPGGFGSPRISTHLHNGHTASESDGNPADFYPPNPVPAYLPQYPASIRNLIFRDHHYAMFRAGLDPRVSADNPGPNKDDGDIAETLSTLWYHDHAMDHTAENVYKGLVGFHLFFDEIDSGNENDPSPKALRLPSGEFDIPLLFQDKRFDANGQLFLPRLDSDPPPMLGVLGDRFTVNGQIQPKLTVLRRKYRFRLLNAGPSRFYQFFLTKDGKDQAFIQISNDESLLEKPYDIPPNEGVPIAVSERADVVIDFSRYTKGDKLFLVNRLVMQDEGFGPVVEAGKYKILPEGEGDQILCFEVGGDAVDPSQVPNNLRKNPHLPDFTKLPSEDLKKLLNHREFRFGVDDATGAWAINERPFDQSPAGDTASSFHIGCLDTPRSGLPGEALHDGEVWTIRNCVAGPSPGPSCVPGSAWAHPVHIHMEEFRILYRNGQAPLEPEQTKKDVLSLAPDEEVQVFLRFRDFYGKYPIHCHNVLHEDHEMMLRFDVVGDN
jgi:FtsP/CotA-like multicopper oxidase with cupredoxin domain